MSMPGKYSAILHLISEGAFFDKEITTHKPNNLFSFIQRAQVPNTTTWFSLICLIKKAISIILSVGQHYVGFKEWE